MTSIPEPTFNFTIVAEDGVDSESVARLATEKVHEIAHDFSHDRDLITELKLLPGVQDAWLE